MTQNIAIIGAGNLGSRHLQSLQTIPESANIHVIDPHTESLSISKSRWEDTGAPQKVFYHAKIPRDLPVIDCAIVACTADIRAEATRKLLQTTPVKNIVFEKVLFQAISDYYDIQTRLKQNEVKAWVNCTRRIWPVYSAFKRNIGDGQKIHMHVSGHQWGMGCNSVHMLDLAAFLSGTTEYTIKSKALDKETIPSKRQGFIEFTGSFSGIFGNGSTFCIESFSTPELPYTLSIKSQKGSLIVYEDNDFYDIYENDAWHRENLIIPYQSQLSGGIVNTILESGTCDLTSFDNSCALHIPMLEMFLAHMGKDIKICPIT